MNVTGVGAAGAGIESGVNSFFSFLHGLTSGLRSFIQPIAPDWFTLILLGGSLLGGYFLAKKYPSISPKVVMIVYGIIIFLIVKFI